jgi:hypothetical protein
MVDPEIARRCRFCGASIRIRGSFCPQCGKPTRESTEEESEGKEVAQTEEVFDAADTVSVDLSGLPTADLTNYPPLADTVPLHPIPAIERAVVREDERPTVPLSQPPPSAATPRVDGTRPRPVRESVGGDVKRGLGKVREISTVVIEEASYDPSARFVLVAAVLFILFLIIVFLSEMTR